MQTKKNINALRKVDFCAALLECSPNYSKGYPTLDHDGGKASNVNVQLIINSSNITSR